MNIKIFENEDHIVIDISKNGLKNQISESTLLASLLQSIASLGCPDIQTIPGLARVEEETEPVLPQDDSFQYNGKSISEITDAEMFDAMLSLWAYQKTHSLKVSEVEALKIFVRDNLCFIDEAVEEIDFLKNILSKTESQCPQDDADIRTATREVIDDMIAFAILS